MRGTVKKLLKEKGFGFIKGEDGTERFFHRDSCAVNFEALQEGDPVEFTDEKSPKGPRASDVRHE